LPVNAPLLGLGAPPGGLLTTVLGLPENKHSWRFQRWFGSAQAQSFAAALRLQRFRNQKSGLLPSRGEIADLHELLSLPRSRFVEPRWMPQLRNPPHLRSEEPRHVEFPNRPHVSSKSPRHLQPQRTFHASASKTSAPTNPCGTIETSAPKLGTSSSEEPSTLRLQKASALRAPKKRAFST